LKGFVGDFLVAGSKNRGLAASRGLYLRVSLVSELQYCPSRLLRETYGCLAHTEFNGDNPPALLLLFFSSPL